MKNHNISKNLLLLFGLIFSCAVECIALQPPADLRVEQAGINTVNLSWQDTNSGAASFAIERSIDEHQYKVINHLNPGITTYQDSGLQPGTLYFYRLRAYQADQISSYSNWVYVPTLYAVSTSRAPRDLFASWQSNGSVAVTWIDAFGNELGYDIERSDSSGNVYSLLTRLGPDVVSYVDNSIHLPNLTYNYRVRAVGAANQFSAFNTTSAALFINKGGLGQSSAAFTSSTLQPAPTNIQARVIGSSQVEISWNYNNPAGSFLIRKSWGGPHSQYLTTVTGTTRSYLYTLAHTEMPMRYSVIAKSGTAQFSLPSIEVEATTNFDATLAVPANLQLTQNAGAGILSWNYPNGNVQGFAIEVSDTDWFSRLATVPQGTFSYSVPEVSGKAFRVQALSAVGGSRYSNVAYSATPQEHENTLVINSEVANPRTEALIANGIAHSNPITISRFFNGSFNELRIVGTSLDDRINVAKQTDGKLRIEANNSVQLEDSVGIGELAIWGANGNDTIKVEPSVPLRARLYGGNGNNALNYFGSEKAYLVGLSGGSDMLAGNGRNTSYWADQVGIDSVYASQFEIGAGRVHRINTFYGGVNKVLDGQAISGASFYSDAGTVVSPSSLWGLGPSMLDVNQGFQQNCPLTSLYGALAFMQPDILEEWAVDLGDGTYAVQYQDPLAATEQRYARVDGRFKPNILGRAGPAKKVWWLVLEKTTSFGLGLLLPSPTRDIDLPMRADSEENHQLLQASLIAKKAITSATRGLQYYDAPLVSQGHSHSVLQSYRDRNGATNFVIRNPYGDSPIYHFSYSDPASKYMPNLGLITLKGAAFSENFMNLGESRGTSSDYRKKVTVNNRPPLAQPDTALVQPGQSGNLTPLSNDSDPDGNQLYISWVGVPLFGEVQIRGTIIYYTAAAGFSGPDLFEYGVADAFGNESSSIVKVNVQTTANPPSMPVNLRIVN